MVTFEEFKKLDIRIGKIIAVEKVEGADKLLKLILNFDQEKRQILAGIAEFYTNPEELIGKEIPIIVNIEPRKFKGETSEGMMLAADVDGKPVLLLPEVEVPVGSIVR